MHRRRVNSISISAESGRSGVNFNPAPARNRAVKQTAGGVAPAVGQHITGQMSDDRAGRRTPAEAYISRSVGRISVSQSVLSNSRLSGAPGQLSFPPPPLLPDASPITERGASAPPLRTALRT